MTADLPASGIGRSVALANVLIAGGALLLTGVVLIALQFVLARNALVADLELQARIAGINSAAALLFDDRKTAEETLGAFKVSPSLEAAAIFRAARTPLASYVREPGIAAPQPTPQLLAEGHRFGLTSVVVAEPIDYNGQRIGWVLIRSGLEHLYLGLGRFAALTLLVAAGALGMTLPLLSAMKRRVLRAEEHLQHIANVDPVTDLPNRRSFNDRLSRALSEMVPAGQRVGLVTLDLDNFKLVNDTFGHHFGDRLLTAIAQRLPAGLRANGVLCRIGGDEFAAILAPAADGGDAYRAGQHMLAALAEPFSIGGHELYVTASAGASVSPDDGTDVETLARNADTAMYHAKRRGKNSCSAFRPEMDERALHRLALERDLHRALERGEFELYYQPQVRLADRRIVAVEALLRWRHPQRGQIGPVEFIDAAESCGLIVPIGRWVLRTACAQAARWHEAGLGPLQMAVNVSVRQMREKDLLSDVLDALKDARLPPQQLELEITESLLMETVEAGVSLLQRLRVQGIGLAIDDFGTGYSSLSYLPTYQVDKLKIDQRFVQRIPGDGATIVSAILAMAHSLGLAVVAEGVERPEQAEFLRQAGCAYAQGFLFAQPLPAEQVGELLRQQSAQAQPGADSRQA